MPEDELRAEFEAWWTLNISPNYIEHKEDGFYTRKEAAYEAYRAAYTSGYQAGMETNQAVCQDLAMMCRRLSYALNRRDDQKAQALVKQCVDLLKQYGLGGSVLRADATQREIEK